MGGVRNRAGHILAHPRADRVLLGLRRVSNPGRQAGSGPPAGQPHLHAHGPLLRQLRVVSADDLAVRQRHERPAVGPHHPAAVLDRHAPDAPPAGARRQQGRNRPAPHAGHHGLRRGRRPGLRLVRHVLVLRRRSRGVRLLVVLHRPGLLAHPQVGEPRRAAAFRRLPDPHRIHNRRERGRAPAQPALHPGHRPGVRLPQVPWHERVEVACHPGGVVRRHRAGALRPGAGLHQGGAGLRALLRQHLRHGLQRGRADIRRRHGVRLHLVPA